MLNNNNELFCVMQLTTSGHVSRKETWEARSAGIAACSVVTFCVHAEISTQLTFIDIWKEKSACNCKSQISSIGTILLTMYSAPHMVV